MGRRAAVVGVLAAVGCGVLSARAETPTPVDGDPATFRVVRSQVAPSLAFVAGTRPASVALRFGADGPLTLTVDVINTATGGVARRWIRTRARPARVLRLRWNGLLRRGLSARDSRYVVRVRPAGGVARRLGSFALRGHAYPIRGSHFDRGGIGYFGAPRGGGRIHEGYDVNASCGVPVVAARAGRVSVSRYDDRLYGHHVIIQGTAEDRDYWYSHLLPNVRVRRGDYVTTGQRLGDVGASGNARTIGCHLHFEIHQRGRPIDPEPSLHQWDGWS